MRPPDRQGRGVRAWNIQKPKTPKEKAWNASVAQWLVNCTWGHPAWQWWVVNMVSLREIEGVKPAHKLYPEAEFEFMIFSVDPHLCPNPDPEKFEDGYPFLTPFDVVHQFHGVSERDAARICLDCIQAICVAAISPDSDFAERWKRMINATVAHYRAGGHPES